MKVRGQKLNINMVKQTADKSQQILGDHEAAGIASWCQMSIIEAVEVS